MWNNTLKMFKINMTLHKDNNKYIALYFLKMAKLELQLSATGARRQPAVASREPCMVDVCIAPRNMPNLRLLKWPL